MKSRPYNKEFKSKVIHGGRLVWVAWYGNRKARCSLFFRHCKLARYPRFGKWHLTLAVGPAYLGLGPGVPEPLAVPKRGVKRYIQLNIKENKA